MSHVAQFAKRNQLANSQPLTRLQIIIFQCAQNKLLEVETSIIGEECSTSTSQWKRALKAVFTYKTDMAV